MLLKTVRNLNNGVLLYFSLFLCVCHLSCQKICSGTLIGFLNVLKYNSLLVMEDHCLALQDIFMKRHMHYLLVKLLQKSRLQMEYLKAQFSEKVFLVFIEGSVFFIASSIIKYVFLSYVSHPLCNYLWCQIIW